MDLGIRDQRKVLARNFQYHLGELVYTPGAWFYLSMCKNEYLNMAWKLNFHEALS